MFISAATNEVQSKSNATDEIKQKLLLVHKNVFSQNFPPNGPNGLRLDTSNV